MKRFYRIVALVLLLALLGGAYAENVELPWYLILVNSTHAMPELWDVEGVALRNNQWVDKRMYPWLQLMFDDCRALGGSIMVNTSFRTYEDQEKMVQSKYRKYKNMGHSDEKAMELAYSVAAVPGYSEHHTGLAVDIVSANQEVCTNDQLWAWLAKYCQNYGFILRFPQGKEDITGISYEPWHFRYVGLKAAKIIMAKGLTLEEYLEDYYNYT